jgi:hypothetical protein
LLFVIHGSHGNPFTLLSCNIVSKIFVLFSLLLSLIPKILDPSLVLRDLILKLSVPLLSSQKLASKFTQVPTNRLVQDAPIQLFKSAQAAQILVT